MNNYAIYTVASGALVSFIKATHPQDALTTQLDASFAVMPLSAPINRLDEWRVVDGVLVERPSINPIMSSTTIPANGVSECVIAGLPDPCRVIVRGPVSAGPIEIIGGTLTLTSTEPGEIRISVRADPIYKPWEAIIHAA
jgi:hypothetical protein